MSKKTRYVGTTIPNDIADMMEKEAKKQLRSVSSMYAIAAKYYLDRNNKKQISE